ncbi:molybdopterin molybdotransferase MoeA [Natrarchaeobius oligotrophus]|uniref:Molybdopterin molybdenumtransferase MoeA n=1 Tax=Natrarchaeobius chitinivorans TaxID=1679083 RepID=A0A3N6MEY8_NATCH|nr:molybdopterin molybdotransferase MoeA [Natrarchaeobius chitinivorans]RQH02489.1 molybdopterin molybdenumtransferase MoeA [Natrarchaeobius chitinivorans]
MDHGHDDMRWRSEATKLVLERRSIVLENHGTESVSLDEIGGRTLAEPIVAERDVPAHDRATMDGYAFDATDDYPLALVDEEVFPEDEPPSIEAGEAVAIATGAPLPPEANAVLKREESSVEDGLLRGTELEPGTYTYERGSNLSAGETLFERGERLSSKDAILLGDLGRETVPVHERFSTGLLATGTEIHEGRIADLDSDMLAGLIRSWGHEATYEGSVPDDYDRVESAIDRLASEYDVVLTTGGTSVGHKDHVVRALDSLGEVSFHRVRIRPGKPIAMATMPDHDAVAFAIPGKPIGAHTISTFVMRPFFTGETALSTVEATMTHDIELGPEGFEYVIPVLLEEDDGGYAATGLGHADSPLSVYDRQFDPSVLSSSTRASSADGVVVTRSALEEGTAVSVVPYPVLE